MMNNQINKDNFIGKWHISEMELWDSDYINEEVQGYFVINENNHGEFQFGYVHGIIDYKYITKDNDVAIVFSWSGNDEMDLSNGRGYMSIINKKLIGRIFIYHGDSSSFIAVKSNTGTS